MLLGAWSPLVLAQEPARAPSAVPASPASDAYPTRTLTLIGSSPPGGQIEQVARLLATRLAERFNQSVVVETRPGADGRIAGQAVASSPPDGHVLLVAPTSTGIDIAFDPAVRPNVLRDLAPVAPLLGADSVLVVDPRLPFESAAALVAWGRANPGALNFATTGPRSSQRLVTELFMLKAGLTAVHVPYKGAIPQITAVIAGDVQMAIAPLPASLPFIRAGKLRALAIASAQRSPLLPAVPTMKEAGFDGVEGSTWFVVFAPAATPAPTIERLWGAIDAVSAEPAYRETLQAAGERPLRMSPAELRAMIEGEVVKWRKVIVAADVKVEQ